MRYKNYYSKKNYFTYYNLTKKSKDIINNTAKTILHSTIYTKKKPSEIRINPAKSRKSFAGNKVVKALQRSGVNNI